MYDASKTYYGFNGDVAGEVFMASSDNLFNFSYRDDKFIVSLNVPHYPDPSGLPIIEKPAAEFKIPDFVGSPPIKYMSDMIYYRRRGRLFTMMLDMFPIYISGGCVLSKNDRMWNYVYVDVHAHDRDNRRYMIKQSYTVAYTKFDGEIQEIAVKNGSFKSSEVIFRWTRDRGEIHNG